MTIVKLFCPKVGRPSLPSHQIIAVCTINKDCLYAGYSKDQTLGCPDPLQGQVVTLEDIPIMPIVLLPSYTGGKVSGYGVNLFLMYAKKYQFTPNIKFASTLGNFFPNNNSFSPGLAGNASYQTGLVFTVHHCTGVLQGHTGS